jgi:heme/copper-type cytochrome/quinol oxidase subunit 2
LNLFSRKEPRESVASWMPRVLAAIVMMLAVALPCAAQCAMCRASVANGENAAEMSHTINSGVLILFFPTIAIISGFVGLVLKYRHSKGGEMEDRSVTKDPTS